MNTQLKKLVTILIATTAAISMVSAEKIHLKTGKINPETASADTTSGIPEYAFLHLEDDVKPSEVNKSDDIRLLGYVPETWYARLEEGSRNVEGVESVVEITRNDRISPQLVRELYEDPRSERVQQIRVEFFGPVNDSAAKRILEGYGEVERGGGTYVLKTGDGRLDAVLAVASHEEVKWVSQSQPEAEGHLSSVTRTIGADKVHESGFTGLGSTIAMWDSGTAGKHPDLDGKTSRMDGASVTGHATHVGSILAGTGEQDASKDGIAPDAGLLSYKWAVSSTSELFQETSEASSRGSRISHNSWGWVLDSKQELSSYGSYSRAYDSIVAGKATQPMTVVFSAGNEADNWNNPYGTLTGTGATAKNTITVGAVYGDGSLTQFSSRGPTDDGRLKPELVSDGAFVQSAKPGGGYSAFSGTSAAAPSVSASADLFQQVFKDSNGRYPRPATVKASLIHTAKDLHHDGPDFSTGFGMVQADSAAKLAREGTLKRGKFSSEGEKHTYSFDSSTEKVTLVWTDPPAQQTSGKALVNDLDLRVSTDGENYRPMVLDPGNPSGSATSGDDDRNPVEQVRLPDSAGSVEVTVEAEELPVSGQSYSLVTFGEDSTGAPSVSILSPRKDLLSSSPAIKVEAPRDATVAYNTGSGYRQMNYRDGIYTGSTSLPDGTHTVKVAATEDGKTATSSTRFTVDSTPPDLDVESPGSQEYQPGKISFRASSPEQISLKVDGQYYRFDGSRKIDLDAGSHNAVFTAKDAAGNTARKKVSFEVVDDRTDVSYGIVKPGSKTYTGEVPVEVNAPGRYVLLLDGREVTGKSSLNLEPGSYTLRMVYVVDGQTRSDSVSFTVQDDTSSGDDGTSSSAVIKSSSPVDWNSAGTSDTLKLESGTQDVKFKKGSFSVTLEDADLEAREYSLKVDRITSGTVEEGIAVSTDMPYGSRRIEVSDDSKMPVVCHSYDFGSGSCGWDWGYAYGASTSGSIVYTGEADAFGLR